MRSVPRSCRLVLTAMILIFLTAPPALAAVSTAPHLSEADPYTLYPDDAVTFRHNGAEPFYAGVHVTNGRPLVVTLTPLDKDFDLEVWGRSAGRRRRPSAASNRGGLSVDEVMIETTQSDWFIIRVTPHQHSGGRFTLAVRTLAEDENPTAGESEENPLPLPLGVFVDGYVTQKTFYRVETGEGIEPLVVTLVPATADLDLAVWGADEGRPRAESNNPGAAVERVILERWENRNFTVEVFSFSRNPGAFRLRAHLQRGSAAMGAMESNPIPLNLNEAVHGRCAKNEAVFYSVEVGRTRRPLIVELIPDESNLDLDVWGGDDGDYTPYQISANPALSTESVRIETYDDNEFLIMVTAPERASDFTLRTRLAD